MDLNIATLHKPTTSDPPNLTHRRGSRRCWIKDTAQVAAGSSADQVRVIGRRTDTHSPGGTAEQIAQSVGEILEDIRRVLEGGDGFLVGEDLVPDGKVVGRTGGALDGGVSLEVEVPVAGLCDAAVDDGAVLGVGGAVGVLVAGGVEAGVMAFADDDDGDAREVLLGACGGVGLYAGLLEQGQFLLDDDVVLAFGDTVAVDDDVLWEGVLVGARPALQPGLEHLVQV